MPQPTKIPQSWAGQGDYNVIPDQQLNTGMCSWELGFPPETQDPLAAGGVPPNRQDMNGALNWLSLFAMWNQQGGLWEYDALTDFEPPALVVQNNVLYWCMSANGPSGTVKAPSADSAGTYWKKLVNSDGSLNVPVIGNATTSARGIVELATSAETKALTDSQRAVTPSSLNGLLSLSPAALTVPKADSSAKLTGWLDAFKGGDGRVNISINGTAPKLQTARTVRVNLASTSAVNFDGSVNITPGVNGTLAVGNGGTGQNDLDLVTVGKAKALNTARTVRTNLASTSSASFDGTANITPGVTGTLAVANGGTGQTNLDNVTVGKAKALNTARNIQINLASTSAASFNGTANVTPGVTGTLPVANGGTGQTNLDNVTVGKAKALNTARNIQTNLNSTSAASFNGTANITPGVTGVLPISNGGTGSATKNFVDLTTSQTITAAKTISGDNVGWNVTNGTYRMDFEIGTGGTNRGVWDYTSGHWMWYATASDIFFKGLADRAEKLETPRAINGTVFDGTAAITTAKWGTARNVTIKDATQTHTGAATSVNGSANFSLLLPSTIKAALNGNADTATKLATARTINGTSFDGTSNIIAMESSARSLNNNGYIKFQSGLIVAWSGTGTSFSGNNYVEVDISGLPFTQRPFVVLATDYLAGAGELSTPYNIGWQRGDSTKDKICFFTDSPYTSGFGWVAIGV